MYQFKMKFIVFVVTDIRPYKNFLFINLVCDMFNFSIRFQLIKKIVIDVNMKHGWFQKNLH